MNLENLLSNSGYNFFFLVVDKNLDISLSQIPNFQSLYLDNLTVKNSGYLLSQNPIQEIIKNTPKPVIVPFKPSAKIEKICQNNNWINASNPAKINRLLEDKIKFYELCQKNSLPLLPSTIAPFSPDSFSQAQKLYGASLVTQTHFGWAGNSTHFFNNYKDAQKNIPQNTLTKFSPFLENTYSLLNNCCLTKHGLIQSPPALQFTGLKNFTENPFATVGRQWPSLAPQNILDKVKQITTDFSEKILKPLDYHGFFGLDFIVLGNDVYLLECNPRLTASFAFYTSLELNQNLTPLFYYHLAEFSNLDYQIDIQKEQSRFDNQNLIGAELTQRNSVGQIIKKYNNFETFTTQSNPIIINPQILAKFS